MAKHGTSEHHLGAISYLQHTLLGNFVHDTVSCDNHMTVHGQAAVYCAVY